MGVRWTFQSVKRVYIKWGLENRFKHVLDVLNYRFLRGRQKLDF